MCDCNKRTVYVSDISGRGSYHGSRQLVKVKLMKNAPFVLNGDITGRTYAFKQVDEILMVDRRDAENISNSNVLQIIS